MMNPFKKKQLI